MPASSHEIAIVSDAASTMGMVPRWFRVMHTRRHRERQRLRLQLQQADALEDGVFSGELPIKRDLLWLWW